MEHLGDSRELHFLGSLTSSLSLIGTSPAYTHTDSLRSTVGNSNLANHFIIGNRLVNMNYSLSVILLLLLLHNDVS